MSWAEWGLPGFPDGDIHRAAAFLDKSPGNQAAVQILTSQARHPGVHLLTAQGSHRARGFVQHGPLWRGTGNGSSDPEPVEATLTAEQPQTCWGQSKADYEVATSGQEWPPERRLQQQHLDSCSWHVAVP